MQEGFDGYVSKPIETDKLETVMMRLLPQELLQKPKEEAPLPAVLAVIDDAGRLSAMQSSLRETCRLAPVRTAAQAGAYLEKHRPEALLCDLACLDALRAELSKALPPLQIALTKAPAPDRSAFPIIEEPLTPEKLKAALYGAE